MTSSTDGRDSRGVIRDPRVAAAVFSGCDELALDLETSALKFWKGGIMTVNIADANGEVAVLHSPSGELAPETEDLLRQQRCWVTHNGTNFDWHWLQWYGFEAPAVGRHFDTLIAEQVLAVVDRRDIRKDLGSTLKRRLKEDVKATIDHRGWMNATLTDEQVAYAALDVLALMALKDEQLKLAKERRLSEAMEKEQQLTSVIMRIGYNGLQLDSDRMYELILKALEDAQAAAQRLGGLNVNSSKQVLDRLRREGLRVHDSRATTLMPLADRHQIVDDILRVRRARKRDSMYSEKMETDYADAEGLVRAAYWQIAAETTRFTCSDPNLQQIPRDMRSMFGSSDPAKRVVATDYSQLEVRVAAELANDPQLVEAIDSEDLHTHMAQIMFSKDAVSKEERRDGKAGTFTWLFAGGAKGIQTMGASAGFEIDTDTARQMVQRLSQRFRGVATWHSEAQTACRNLRAIPISLPWGHKRVLVGAQRAPTKVCNTMVQGTAAIGLKEALFEAHRRNLTNYIGGLVHDEIVATNVPVAEAEGFRQELEEAMLVGMQKLLVKVPIEVESKVGGHWS